MPPEAKLDDEISAIFSLLGLLLVFVIGYFSALWPRIEEEIARPIPEPADDRLSLAVRLRTYRRLFVGVIALDGAVLVLLSPVTARAIDLITAGPSFPTIRAGLLLVDGLLLAVGIVSAWLAVRLAGRARAVAPP